MIEKLHGDPAERGVHSIDEIIVLNDFHSDELETEARFSRKIVDVDWLKLDPAEKKKQLYF